MELLVCKTMTRHGLYYKFEIWVEIYNDMELLFYGRHFND
jgi:hypothetical protein